MKKIARLSRMTQKLAAKLLLFFQTYKFLGIFLFNL